jgi:hypothetical protein
MLTDPIQEGMGSSAWYGSRWHAIVFWTPPLPFLDLMAGIEYDEYGSCKVGDGNNYLSR